MKKTLILFFVAVTVAHYSLSAQTKAALITLPEGNTGGDGTFLGVVSYATQPTNVKSFALEHHFYGVINNSINFYRGGSTSGGFLTFNTNANNEQMRIDASGNVGIGTSSPQSKLDVIGNFRITSNSTAGFINLFTISGNPKIISNAGLFLTSSNLTNDFYGAGSLVAIGQVNEATGYGIMNIVNGNVGIGTTAPDYKLSVKGKIHAEEVIVDLNVPAADYVFSKDYTLMPLNKVEQYVQTHNHLPDIPSATDVKVQGLSMGNMQNKLLQKIEELTLYAIEQNKQISQQNKKIEQLEKQNAKIEGLEKRLKELENK